jgi:hypothetical protein
MKRKGKPPCLPWESSSSLFGGEGLMKNIIRFLIISVFINSTLLYADEIVKKQANWTVMICIQASNNLNKFAVKNLKDMAAIGSSKNLNILALWKKPRATSSWRYKVLKDKIAIQHKETKVIPYEEEVTNFVRWSHETYPAKHYALIFWDHGSGVLDPSWSKLNDFTLSPTLSMINPRLHFSDYLYKSTPHRGIMFDEQRKSYLNNHGLVGVLKEVSTILNQKIDFFGMDACYMQMLGVLYPLRHYANYCTASEEVELAYGWSYTPLLSYLSQDTFTMDLFAHTMAESYQDFYKRKTSLYTQSTIQLNRIEIIKRNLDGVVSIIQELALTHPEIVRIAIDKSRRRCLQFSTPHYIDLHSFYHQLQKECTRLQERNIEPSLTTSEEFNLLKDGLSIGMKEIEESVLANVTSPRLSKAKGIAIYFPKGNSIDASYLQTDFAKEGLWLDFLSTTLEKRIE